jgi:hypothetical protein
MRPVHDVFDFFSRMHGMQSKSFIKTSQAAIPTSMVISRLLLKASYSRMQVVPHFSIFTAGYVRA